MAPDRRSEVGGQNPGLRPSDHAGVVVSLRAMTKGRSDQARLEHDLDACADRFAVEVPGHRIRAVSLLDSGGRRGAIRGLVAGKKWCARRDSNARPAD